MCMCIFALHLHLHLHAHELLLAWRVSQGPNASEVQEFA